MIHVSSLRRGPICAFFMCLWGCLISCQHDQGREENQSTSLSQYIDSVLTSNQFNGVALVAKGDEVVYAKVMGYADIDAQTKLKREDHFVIGSVSKQITAVLILRELEQGRIKLTDKLATYLPSLTQAWADEVDVHQLLTHTHGITDMEEPLAFEPGSTFAYSQLGYELLANILETVRKESFQDMSTEFFASHGLQHTFHPDQKERGSLVRGYVEGENGELTYTENSLRNYVPAGSFISNADDLITWNSLLHSGRLLSKETVELMRTRYATREHPIFDEVEYGYGLLFKDGEANRQIGALGYAPGFVSASYYYPQTDMHVVVLENVAKSLGDFKQTFQSHTAIMDRIKKEQ